MQARVLAHMTQIFNKSSQLLKRKRLRNDVSHAERILWRCLRDRHFGHNKFRRQYSIGRFVVDFYCPSRHLVIEVDGGYHDTNDMRTYDRERQDFIESLGLMVIRFTNHEIEGNLKNALKKINEKLVPLSFRRRGELGVR